MRRYSVKKFVELIFPTTDTAVMRDKRMQNLIAYATKFEGETYEFASSRSEYYHLLAMKISKIRQDLKLKGETRNDEQPPPPIAPTINWHQSVKSELRKSIFEKLVRTIFPNANDLANDKRMPIIALAEKFEKETFEKANSKSEYLSLIAKKIYKLQKHGKSGEPQV